MDPVKKIVPKIMVVKEGSPMEISKDLILQIKDFLQRRYQEIEIGLKYWREKNHPQKIQDLRSSQAKIVAILDRIVREVEKIKPVP